MLKEAIAYARIGVSVIPLKAESKIPVGSNWQSLPFADPEDLPGIIKNGRNIGVRTGKPSKIGGKYLHIVDMDIRDAEYAKTARKQAELALEIPLSEFPTVISGSRGHSRHFYLLLNSPHPTIKIWHSDEKMIGEDGKEHWCAEVELLGTGRQAVLPPSIHPETKLPYIWEGDLRVEDAPLIDEDLLVAATTVEYDNEGNHDPIDGMTLDEAAAILDTLKDWANDHATWRNAGMAIKHQFGQKGFEIFDAWSKRGSGYHRGNNLMQWRRFKEDRERPITMRSLIAAANEIEHEIVIEEIREELEADPVRKADKEPPIPSRNVLLDLFGPPLEPREEKSPVAGVPAHLLTVPGRLGLAVEHYNATTLQDQPQFAVQAALALGSVVCGRYWTTDVDNYTSLYFVNLGMTGAGKEFTRKFLAKTLAAAHVGSLMGPNQFASEAAVMGELIYNPRNVAVIDEFGKILGSTKKSSSTNMKDAQTALLSIFGLTDGEIRPKAYSANGKSSKQVAAEKKVKIVRPALTVVGMSTVETFYDALGQEDVGDGFMNRLLIVNSRMPLGKKKLRGWKYPPKLLLKWIREHVLPVELEVFLDRPEFLDEGEGADEGNGNALGEETGNPHDAQVVPFTSKAFARLSDIEDWIIAERKSIAYTKIDGLYARAHEITMKLSLIVALSKREDEISVSSVNWAWDYVKFYTQEMVENAIRLMGSNPVIRTANHVAEIVSQSGKFGVSIQEIRAACFPFKQMAERERAEVLARVLSDHEISLVKVQRKGAGRPTERYMMTEIAEAMQAPRKRRKFDEDDDLA